MKKIFILVLLIVFCSSCGVEKNSNEDIIQEKTQVEEKVEEQKEKVQEESIQKQEAENKTAKIEEGVYSIKLFTEYKHNSDASDPETYLGYEGKDVKIGKKKLLLAIDLDRLKEVQHPYPFEYSDVLNRYKDKIIENFPSQKENFITKTSNNLVIVSDLSLSFKQLSAGPRVYIPLKKDKILFGMSQNFDPSYKGLLDDFPLYSYVVSRIEHLPEPLDTLIAKPETEERAYIERIIDGVSYADIRTSNRTFSQSPNIIKIDTLGVEDLDSIPSEEGFEAEIRMFIPGKEVVKIEHEFTETGDEKETPKTQLLDLQDTQTVYGKMYVIGNGKGGFIDKPAAIISLKKYWKNHGIYTIYLEDK